MSIIVIIPVPNLKLGQNTVTCQRWEDRKFLGSISEMWPWRMNMDTWQHNGQTKAEYKFMCARIVI